MVRGDGRKRKRREIVLGPYVIVALTCRCKEKGGGKKKGEREENVQKGGGERKEGNRILLLPIRASSLPNKKKKKTASIGEGGEKVHRRCLFTPWG